MRWVTPVLAQSQIQCQLLRRPCAARAILQGALVMRARKSASLSQRRRETPKGLRPCLGCGRLGVATRCDNCRKEVERLRSRQRTSRPHYAGDYRKRAAQVRATATCCYWCGEPFTTDNPVQADHLLPANPESPLVGACRRCNIGRSNRQRRKVDDGDGRG